MSKGPVRFTSQWALVSVILFYTVGTVMIASHTKRIFKPTSAGGNDCSEYSIIPETPNRSIPVIDDYWQNSIPGLINWSVWDYNLYYDSVLGIEPFTQDGNTSIISGPFAGQSTEKDYEVVKKDVRQELAKIRTQRKCVERILRKAVIEPYYLNGQVEGLQVTGLDEKTEAEAVFLKNGDIILAVNGQILNSKKEAYEIFIKARKEPIMIIDLLQKGQNKKYLLDFQ